MSWPPAAFLALIVALVVGAFTVPDWADDIEQRRPVTLASGTLYPPAPPQVLTRTATVTEPAVPVVPRTDPPPPPTTDPPGPPQPVDGDCASWRPLLEFYRLPWDTFRPILWRESRCTNAHASDSDDESHGGLQVNRIGNLGAAWDSLGFDHAYMHTATGAIHAAGVLYERCGLGPWIRQYRCGFPNGAKTRWDFP